jgi:uncharacterized protein (TIGR02145 family)
MKVIKSSSYLIAITALFFILFSCNKNDNADNISGQVLFPKGGEFLVEGYTYPINWNDNTSSDVRIKLYKSDNFYRDIIRSTLNTGQYTWRIPHNLGFGFDYKIKIFSNSNDFLFYQSSKTFTIIDSCETSTFTDPRDNRTYQTIKIGNQWWFAENFKFECENSYYCYKNSDYLEAFGKLYTYYAALNSNPPGWHLPSDDDWKELEAYIGISASDIKSIGYRGGNVNMLFKDGGIGFNLRYSGYYKPSVDYFYYFNTSAYFWSSTGSEGTFWYRSLTINALGIYRGTLGGTNAMSVRYIKD